MILKAICLLLIGGLLASCSGTTVTPTAEPPAAASVYRTMSIEELANVLENEREQFAVINVHIPYAGEIDGTDANVPFNDLDALVAALPNKDAPIVLYCRSGAMSAEAAQNLADRGYTQIYDVPGGMNAWTASGRTLIDRP